jgi:hypothetical protein
MENPLLKSYGVRRSMLTHLGSFTNDLEPKQAAHENRIVVCLRKRGGSLSANTVKLYTGAVSRVGHEMHESAVNSLIMHGVIRKHTTTRANSFILELVTPFPDARHRW